MDVKKEISEIISKNMNNNLIKMKLLPKFIDIVNRLKNIDKNLSDELFEIIKELWG